MNLIVIRYIITFSLIGGGMLYPQTGKLSIKKAFG